MDVRLFRICPECDGVGIISNPSKGTSRACRKCVMRHVIASEYDMHRSHKGSVAVVTLRRLVELTEANATDAIAYLDALVKSGAWKKEG